MFDTQVRKKFALTLKSVRTTGDEENRTPDPLLARQVLSQLSYTPKFLLILCPLQLAVLVYCLRFASSSEQKLPPVHTLYLHLVLLI